MRGRRFIAMTSTAHAALLFAGAPVLTGLLTFPITGIWPRPLWWVGGAIALAGEAVLIFGRQGPAGGPATIAGDLIVFASVICIAVGYVAGARLSAKLGLMAATGWSILTACVFVLPFLPALWQDLSSNITLIGGWSLGYLVLASTLIGYGAWFWALDTGRAARIAPIQFGQPVVSLVLAVLMLSEPLGLTVALALALILGGVALCRKSA